MNHKSIFVTGGLKNRSPPALWPMGNFNQSAWGSELSRQIAVDLESDADLDEGRGCPGHWPFPSVFMNTARYIGSRSESNLRGAQFACDRTITAATSASIAAGAFSAARARRNAPAISDNAVVAAPINWRAESTGNPLPLSGPGTPSAEIMAKVDRQADFGCAAGLELEARSDQARRRRPPRAREVDCRSLLSR
jgi:hypothetical protein